MKTVNKSVLALGLTGLLFGAQALQTANADMAVAVRAGTFGYGADFDVGLIEDVLNVRLGYNTFDYSKTVEDTDVTYDGKLKIGAASAILDWHAFHGGFRLSLGAVQKGPKVDVTGKPTNGTYEINGETYSAADIGSLNGSIKMGDSVSPYIGIGWGNTVDKEDRVTFLLDIGAIHAGSPEATLNVTCGPVVPTNECNQLKADVEAERAQLEDDYSSYEWYPVISLGIAVRF